MRPTHQHPRPLVPALVCCVLVLACLSGPIGPGSADPPYVPPVPADLQAVLNGPPHIPPVSAELQTALERPLPPGTHLSGTFSDAIDQIRDVTSANLFLNGTVLRAAGVDHTARISLDVGGRTLGDTLTRLLASAQANTALAYGCDDGVITLSTKADLDRHVLTWVYDVRDLLPPEADVKQLGCPFGPGTGATARRQALNDLVARIASRLVPPQPPSPLNGGWPRNIRELSGQFVINETLENQMQIVATLSDLRQMRRFRETAYVAAEWFTPAALVAWLVLRPLRRGQLIRRRVRRGLCAHCSYDLRSSRGRCPECGMAMA